MFSWYWLADLCAQEKVHFVLGHALYMKAIHGGKAKKRSYRRVQNRDHSSRGIVSLLLCLPGRMAFDPRPAPISYESGGRREPMSF
jgi:hypothetical protein